MASGVISLRGVAVHNLKEVDLDIPRGRLIVLCGLSGSGKTSLALDTLYAEGQQRYIDSFSAYTRQFLERLEKPAAEQIEGIPPAIAVTHKNTSRSSRSTVGTATESSDYLRLLFAKIGELYCHHCGRPVRRDTPQTIAADLARLPAGTKFLIAFELPATSGDQLEATVQGLREQGFVRLIAGERTIHIGETAADKVAEVLGPAAVDDSPSTTNSTAPPWLVIVDRLSAGGASEQRLRDSLEAALSKRPNAATCSWKSRRAGRRRISCTATRYAAAVRRPHLDRRGLQLAVGAARSAESTIPSSSRGCSASTVRWSLARPAKASAT